MGEWKAQLSLRVRQDLRREMEELAARERRTLGNLGEILVSWAVEQLREAGSTEKLFNQKVPAPRKPNGNYRRRSVEEQRTTKFRSNPKEVRSAAAGKPNPERPGLR